MQVKQTTFYLALSKYREIILKLYNTVTILTQTWRNFK